MFYCSYLPLKRSFHTIFAVFLSFVLCCFLPFFSAVTNHLFPLFCLLIQINHSLQFLSVVFFLSLSLFPLATHKEKFNATDFKSWFNSLNSHLYMLRLDHHLTIDDAAEVPTAQANEGVIPKKSLIRVENQKINCLQVVQLI